MSGRVITVCVVVLWVGSWGLISVHGAFAILAVIGTFVCSVAAGVTRQDLHRYRRAKVFLPVTRRDVRHNERAALVRRRERLQERHRVCEELIFTLREDERLRKPVLEAERDAARLEYIRIGEDIERLEEAWKREDRERAYRKLTA